MKDIRDLIKKVIETGYLLSLASVDSGGPWVSDVIYVSDADLNLYFISRLEFRHSKAFEKNPRAAGAITAVEKPEGQSTGVQLAGTISQVKEIPKDAFVRYSQKRAGKNSWTLEPGDAWYKLTPTIFDLIYEPLFGYTKKTLRLR